MSHCRETSDILRPHAQSVKLTIQSDVPKALHKTKLLAMLDATIDPATESDRNESSGVGLSDLTLASEEKVGVSSPKDQGGRLSLLE